MMVGVTIEMSALCCTTDHNHGLNKWHSRIISIRLDQCENQYSLYTIYKNLY